MILPDFVLPSLVNGRWEFSGLDSIDLCLDRKHFKNYPHAITYQYNSRGFRDTEWPDTQEELQQAIWCVGDSFTMGLGSPVTHTWPYLLSQATCRRCINTSMDGASNDWITRKAQQISTTVDPQHIVVMWSYTHRREHMDNTLSDEDRRLWTEGNKNCSTLDDWENFSQCKNALDSTTTAVQFAIPYFDPRIPRLYEGWREIKGPDWPTTAPTTLEEFNALPAWILDELKNLHYKHNYQELLDFFTPTSTIKIVAVDLARDGHHFDCVTAGWVAKQAKNLLNL